MVPTYKGKDCKVILIVIKTDDIGNSPSWDEQTKRKRVSHHHPFIRTPSGIKQQNQETYYSP